MRPLPTGTLRRPLRAIVVTGIFPPDIGGPATHAADLAEELRDRGHRVTVLTLTDESSRQEADGVIRWSRQRSWGLRLAAVTAWLVRNRRRYDVIYATGLHPAAVAGGRLARRPVIVKIVGDPAWERACRLGLVDTGIDGFQAASSAGPRDRLMRILRDWSVRRAAAVFTPSDYLRDMVAGWQGGRGPAVRVVPNGVRVKDDVGSAEHAPGAGLEVLYVGRLVAHKRVDVLVDAVAGCSDVRLTIVGDGPEMEQLAARTQASGAGERISLRGSLDHDGVLGELQHADVMVSASAYEGLPHTFLESLAVGTPVVTSAAGGSSEVIVDGVNGRIVEPPTAEGFATVLAELRDEPDVLAKLRAGAIAAGREWRFERTADAIEGLMREVCGEAAPPVRPRMVNIGKFWIGDPPSITVQEKFALLSRHLDATFLATGPSLVRHVNGVRLVGVPTFFRGMAGGVTFYTVAPALAVGLAAAKRGTVIVCQSPFEAAAVHVLRAFVPEARRPRVVVEIHGDWRTASRCYGSPWRRLLTPLSDGVATWSIRRADRVRPVGPTMERLVREIGYRGPVDPYVAYVNFDGFTTRAASPLPERPQALFVGVLERYKNPEVLLDAWRIVTATLPEATLAMVGEGGLDAALRDQASRLGLDDSVTFVGQVPHEEVAGLLDSSTCLVLPSRSEGLPRVALEAMSRGRPIVGSTGGGIPDAVDDGVNGRLVPAGDAAALAQALIDVLSDTPRAAAMGEAGRRRVEAWDPAGEFEAGVERLAVWATQQ